MKKNTFLVTLLLITNFAIAQNSIINLNLSDSDSPSPKGIFIDGDFLYILESAAGDISRMDLTNADPDTTHTKMMNTPGSGASGPYEDIIIVGTDIYFTARASAGTVYKVDISGDLPAVATVAVDGLSSPNGMALDGNILYISDNFNNRVVKVDISNTTYPLTKTVVASIPRPSGLALNGTDLYVGEMFNNKINKIDISDTNLPLTATEVISGGIDLPRAMTFSGNDLYITSNYKVDKMDVTATTPTLTNIVDFSSDSNIDRRIIRDVKFYENDMYISLSTLDRIYIYANTLSLEGVKPLEKTVLYPNPTSNSIQIKGLETETSYVIYNAIGVETLKGTTSPNIPIDISKISKGIYFIKFNDYNKSFKIIKD